MAAIVISFPLANLSAALERIPWGTAIKETPVYYLPLLAAEDGGLFREAGLSVEWVPFTGSPAMIRAMAAAKVEIGFAPAVSVIQAVERGLALVIVAELFPHDPFYIWVLTDSPLRSPWDLKGARIGLPRLGGTSLAYGRVVAKALGIEKEVRFVGAGGVAEKIAALKTGGIDAMTGSFGPQMKLKAAGEIRELVSVADYLPAEWVDEVAFSRREFITSKKETARKGLAAMLKGIAYARENPSWSVQKMKEVSGYSQDEAKIMFDWLRPGFTRDGQIKRRALENLRSFLLEYGIISKEKAPQVDQLYTQELLE